MTGQVAGDALNRPGFSGCNAMLIVDAFAL